MEKLGRVREKLGTIRPEKNKKTITRGQKQLFFTFFVKIDSNLSKNVSDH